MKGKNCASRESHDGNDSVERVAAKHLKDKHVFGSIIWVELCNGSWWPAVVVDDNTVTGRDKPSSVSAGEVLVRLYGSYEYLYADLVKSHSDFEIVLMENDGCYHDIFRKSLEQELLHLKSGQSKGQQSSSKGASNERVSTKDKRSVTKRVDQEREASDQARGSSRKKMNRITPRYKDIEEASSMSSEEDGISAQVKTTRKTPKEDRVQKKLKQSNPRAKAAKNSTHDGNRVRNGLKHSKKSAEECESPKQDEALKKDEPSTPSSGGTFFGRLQELRRTKVMQSLGLTAPAGSPFHKIDTCT